MKTLLSKKVIFGFLFILISCIVSVILYYYRYRFIPLISIGSEDKIEISNLELYTNKLSYQSNDTIEVFVKSNTNGKGYLYFNKTHIEQIVIDSFSFIKNDYEIDKKSSSKGCAWDISDKIPISTNYNSGCYSLKAFTENDTSVFNILLENTKPSKVAVLAPVSTWTAYNDWGGQSLYINNFEAKTTYFVSTQRPNPKQDIRVENHSTNYFLENYKAMLLPDYALETQIERLKDVDIIILNHHAEYFSELMYKTLKTLVEEYHISLISLGGNQIYWKTKWNSDYTVMECRKDLTSFNNSILDYGGMWRHHFNKAEHRLLGVQFTDAGMHSYAPYKIQEPNHWVFNGLNIKKGDLFGFSGIDHLPLSGDETDKIVSNSSTITCLAKGLNCSKENPIKNLDDNCKENNGADFIIKEEEHYKILSTGSIQSGSGLGIDTVFTRIISNFIDHEIQP